MKSASLFLSIAFSAVVLSLSADPAREWKVVYGSAEGPEGRALEVLTESVGRFTLRDAGRTTAHVLPLERTGTDAVPERKDLIVVGTPADNPLVREHLGGEAVPKGGFVVKTLNRGAQRVILIAGDTPSAVLWGAFDFIDNALGGFESPRFLAERPVRDYRRATTPVTPVRSLFTWGHVIDDYRLFFREMARLKLNRVILWNKHPPLNAAAVVHEAHAWGVAVFWGFAWGWTSDMCKSAETSDLAGLADSIVREWRGTWKPLGGDGIYFQTFTEQDRETIGGRSIASMAVEVVNAASRAIRAESPDLDIVFGLHANSVKTRLDDIARTDKSLEILWENCGGFPYFEHQGEPDLAFTDRILAERPRVGLVWKEQVRQDWSCWVPPAGPYLLGCAGADLLARDRALTDARQGRYTDDWLRRGREAYDLLRHVRAGSHPPHELNLVAEYNPPFRFATVIQAELFWSTEEDYDSILARSMRNSTGQGSGR